MSSDIFIELGPIGVLYFSGLGLPFFGIHTDLEKSELTTTLILDLHELLDSVSR